jgi:hypothetical protein
MDKLLLTILLAALCSINLLAQKESYNWYFGDSAGVSFMPDGQNATFLSGGLTRQMEGTCTISDRNGKVLFYSDGKVVWNAKHQPLNHGGGLLGYASSARSAVIIPRPNSNRYYYVFTIDAYENLGDTKNGTANTNGLRYSIIDIFADPVKNGDIMPSHKNILILNNAVERMIVVNHSNKVDAWLVAFNWKDNTFYTYLITKDGIGNPITSLRPFPQMNRPIESLFNLDYDIDSKRLIECDAQTHSFIIYNFNTSTGKIGVENPITLPAYPAGVDTLDYRLYVPYSGAFSKDGTKFYGTCYQKCLLQYDFADMASVVQSRYVIGDSIRLSGNSVNNFTFGAVRRGPDDKIYVARNKCEYLGVIDSPNAAGDDCDFRSDGLYLEGKKSRYGLPIMLDYELPPCVYSGYAGNDKFVCKGSSVSIGATNVDLTDLSFEWSPKSGLDNPYSLNPICTPDSTTQYILMIKNDMLGCFDYDTVLISVNDSPAFIPSNDTAVCIGVSVMVGNAENDDSLLYSWSPSTYLDNPRLKTPICTPLSSIQYVLTITNATTGCASYDTINVAVSELDFEIEGSDFICEGVNTTLSVPNDYSSYLWSTGDTTNSIVVDTAGKYWVRVIAKNGCVGEKEIEIKFLTTENFNIIAPVAICSGNPTTLSVNGVFSSYLWSTGETTPTIEISSGGTYWVQVENANGCQANDTTTISETSISYAVPDAIIFGNVCLNNVKEVMNAIANNADEPFIVSDVVLAHSEYFSLELKGALPIEIAGKQ